MLEAIRHTPRAAFVPAAYVTWAYDDAPIPIPHQQVTTQLSLSATMIAALGLTGTEEVFEVGTGYGYQTALLAPLAARVVSIDIWPDLAAQARRNLAAQAPLHLVYDVSHNLATIETHTGRQLCVHRKGATRALPPGHPDLPADLRGTGQPVLIPGSMGTSSYVLAGVPGGGAFASACHGAGRMLSRHQAARSIGRGAVPEGSPAGASGCGEGIAATRRPGPRTTSGPPHPARTAGHAATPPSAPRR